MNILEDAIHRDYMELQQSSLIKKWNIRDLTRNRSISLQFIFNHADLPWDWTYLTGDIPLDFVYDHPDHKWDWSLLSMKATPGIVEALYDKPWDWSALSQNKEVVQSLLLTHPEYKWDYKALSKFQFGISVRNKSITYTPYEPTKKKAPPLTDEPSMPKEPPMQSESENTVTYSSDMMVL